MKKTILILSVVFLGGISLNSCGGNEETKTKNKINETNQKLDEPTSNLDTLRANEKKESADSKELALKKIEEKIKLFIISTDNTYGWETNSNDISLDFIKDGRLHIQGPDGESTMWQGKWSLKSDKLTMVRPDLEKNISVTVKINGENLLLDNIIYKRYKP
jgi:hypothetical protein